MRINNYESDIYKSNFLMAVIRNKGNYISNDRFGLKTRKSFLSIWDKIKDFSLPYDTKKF